MDKDAVQRIRRLRLELAWGLTVAGVIFVIASILGTRVIVIWNKDPALLGSRESPPLLGEFVLALIVLGIAAVVSAILRYRRAKSKIE